MSACNEQQQSLFRPTKGRRELRSVLDGEAARRAGSCVDKSAAMRRRSSMARAACSSIASLAARTAPTAANCASIMQSRMSAGSHRSMSAKRGLARSVSMREDIFRLQDQAYNGQQPSVGVCPIGASNEGGRSLEQIISHGNARMTAEAREAPDVVRRQADTLGRPIQDLVARLRRAPPRLVVTCARGARRMRLCLGKGSLSGISPSQWLTRLPAW